MTHPTPLPDLTRPDAGTLLFSEWIVDTPERQQAAADALFGEWQGLATTLRPEAFLQLACFGSDDGRVLLSTALWTSDEEHLAFVREHRAAMVSRIDEALPGIERPGLVRFRRRHTVDGPAAPEPTGTVVVLRAEADTAEAAGGWADAMADALRATGGPGPAHILVSTQGRSVLIQAPAAPGAGRELPVPDGAAAAGVRVGPPRLHRLLGSVTGPRG
ncbi:antibiotic biosynthesis monooxygenase [Streptomyces cacaoi]|uniref:antibiotic biosynthesis monooxygenase n=1 Tax=Streptomyces cacaoi TaxID=1898 RepID=UPI00374A24C8